MKHLHGWVAGWCTGGCAAGDGSGEDRWPKRRAKRGRVRRERVGFCVEAMVVQGEEARPITMCDVLFCAVFNAPPSGSRGGKEPAEWNPDASRIPPVVVSLSHLCFAFRSILGLAGRVAAAISSRREPGIQGRRGWLLYC